MPADKLVALVRDGAKLFTAPDESAWAAIEIFGHRESWPLASRGFKTWLANGYYLRTRKAPMPEAMTQASVTLDAIARFEGGQQQVFLRTGEQDDKFYLDLADEDWRAVEIGRDGWRIVDRPPIHFRRQRGMLPLPSPVRGGEIGELRGFLNVASDDDFLRAVAWLIAALRPTGLFRCWRWLANPVRRNRPPPEFYAVLLIPIFPRCVRRRKMNAIAGSARATRRFSPMTISPPSPFGCRIRCVASLRGEASRRASSTPTAMKS